MVNNPIYHWFFFLFLLFLPATLSAQTYSFNNYNIEEGLKEGYIYSILQDNQGYIWVGTGDGLSRFDGLTFTNFGVPDSLAENFVTSSYVDPDGNIWFGHYQGGISKFDGQQFKKIKVNQPRKSRINQVFGDIWGGVWFITQRSGLIRISEDDSVELYIENFSSKLIYTIVQQENGDFLLGTNEGILKCRYSADEKKFELVETLTTYREGNIQVIKPLLTGREYLVGTDEGMFTYLPAKKDPNLQFQDFVLSDQFEFINTQVIYEDADSVIWVGTKDFGIFKIEKNLKTGKVTGITNINTENGLPNNYITCILEDREGNMWFGTYGGGLVKLIDEKFVVYSKKDGLVNQEVTAIIQDRDKHFWFGTEKGLTQFFINPMDRKPWVENYEFQGDNHEINTLFEMEDNYILIGTSNGLFYYETGNSGIRPFALSNNIGPKIITAITKDNSDNLWISTIGSGVYKYDTYENHWHNYSTNNGLLHNDIYHVFVDSKNNVWLATQGGGIATISKNEIKIFSELQDLKNKDFNCITEDGLGNIWFGTSGDGIFVFNGKTFRNYTTNEGLSSNYCYLIASDINNNIWIGHRTGVTKYDQERDMFKEFGKDEGFSALETNRNAVFKDQDGALWFGTTTGVVKYDPLKEKLNTIEPLTYITEWKVFDDREALVQGTKLPYKKYSITFEFVGICLTEPEKVRYQWQLEGHDLDWSPITSENIAHYPRLEEGKYTFKVRAYNNDGIPNKEPISYSFVISTPFWLTWWFITGSIVLIALIIFIYIRWRLESLQRVKKKLERMVDERTKELKMAKQVAEESKKAKEKFLANMSHEIRTPMNAVLGMTNLLEKTKLEKEQAEFINAIKFSADNLLVIINDILDFSKIEAGKISFEKTVFNVREIFMALINSFGYKASEKNLKLLYNIDKEVPEHLLGDPVRLNQILTNLVGNAIKFTDKGEVELKVVPIKITNKKASLEFRVRDTGIGIPENKIRTIFESFTQAGDEITRLFGGTGLGLAISKQLVEMQGGKINLTSEKGEGSTFYFTVDYEIATADQINASKAKVTENVDVDISGLKILVAEDHEMNRLLLKKLLETWKISADIVENGKLAVEKIEAGKQYDILLMDVQMPEMDGIEATKKIRSLDTSNSKLPIIGVTAFTGDDKVSDVIASGMNEYISKPIDADKLREKIVALVREQEGASKLKLKPGKVAENDEEREEPKPKASKSKYKYIDLSYLNELSAGSNELLLKMIKVFIDQTPSSIERMEQQYRDENWQTLRGEAHKIKPTFIFVGVKEGKQIFEIIEKSAEKKENLDDIPGLLARGKELTIRAIEELEIEKEVIAAEMEVSG